MLQAAVADATFRYSFVRPLRSECGGNGLDWPPLRASFSLARDFMYLLRISVQG